MSLSVEVWSDVVCPWCYIGKRRLEEAVAASGLEVEVVFRSFELDPTAPERAEGAVVDMLATKYGVEREQAVAMQDQVTQVARETGLDYHLDRSLHGSSRAAHRLLHHALAEGGPAVQAALLERLMAAHFGEGRDITDPEVLVDLAIAAGLQADGARAALGSSELDDAVSLDVETGRQFGVTGVPFFVADRRLAMSGAQPPEVFAQFLAQAAAGATA